MKYYAIYFFLFTFKLINGYSQNTHLLIKYASVNKTPNGQVFELFYNLLVTDQWTQFTKIDSSKSNNPYLIQNTSKYNYGLIRDLQKEVFYYSAPILNRSFLVFDSAVSSKFSWKILNDTSTVVLGYTCNIATSHFRGRTYFANFSTEIPINAGPYKFCGLPGAILEIKSDDNYFSYTAFEINKVKSIELQSNPYSNIDFSNFISFSLYKKLIQEKLAAIQQKRQAEEKDGYEYKVEDTSMELFD